LILVLYSGTNIIVLIFKRVNIIAIVVILSIINIILLFLRAYTNLFTNFIRVLLLIYYTFYYFISRVIVIKGIIYVILAFR
jgi:hypothetical protein